jgi:hypothetical protein
MNKEEEDLIINIIQQRTGKTPGQILKVVQLVESITIHFKSDLLLEFYCEDRYGIDKFIDCEKEEIITLSTPQFLSSVLRLKLNL